VWLSPDAPELAPPAYIGDGSVDPRWSRSYYQVDPMPKMRYAKGALRFEYGTRAWHTYGALADAIEYQAALGWDHIFAHVDRMSGRMKETLSEIPGVTVV
jgi:selenocysteine lyase/cysteine desulfurase